MEKTEDGIPVRTLYIPNISIYVSKNEQLRRKTLFDFFLPRKSH